MEPVQEPPHPVVIPILRTSPGEAALRFYRDYLGFSVDWEHRFADGLPLYRQMSRDGAVLHLSEHLGDAAPGSAVRIEVADARGLQRELESSTVHRVRLELAEQGWGDDLVVPDPFGNRIVFHTPR